MPIYNHKKTTTTIKIIYHYTGYSDTEHFPTGKGLTTSSQKPIRDNSLPKVIIKSTADIIWDYKAFNATLSTYYNTDEKGNNMI